MKNKPQPRHPAMHKNPHAWDRPQPTIKAKNNVTRAEYEALKRESPLERDLLAQMLQERIPAPMRGYKFLPPRDWPFDFAWPDIMLAVEVEGGTFSQGRHVRGMGYHGDLQKYNAATLNGWLLLRFDCLMVNDGSAVTLIKEAYQQIAVVRGAVGVALAKIGIHP